MTVSDWITILAILAAPYFAVLATERIRHNREAGERKHRIFRALMSTRGARLAPAHVEALNLIELEFGGHSAKERSVVEAWQVYHAHLGDNRYSETEMWGARSEELLVDLLHKMSVALGYSFDRARLKSSSYSPKGYAEIEEFNVLTRRGVIDILNGERKLHIMSHLPPGGMETILDATYKKQSEQDGAQQPAARSESDSHG